ncbi:hypothetical protein CLV91_3243 [Maribacter vaceletii]|uniref:Uncharacterized protein n=1 Tax=Maribacter vaceletii TaxID=1206816 RepID=A0A495DTN4_9FLAO|nr:hypothetical protein [Maribacter vaceletii]RKR07013.1 hypothetical protein CLV91_3243 [Maribacter vaceletii]
MKKIGIAITALFFSFLSYGQEYKEELKRGTFNFQVTVSRIIHAPRGVSEQRTIFSANVPLECSYYINSAEFETSRENLTQKSHALGAIQIEMRYQFYEFLFKNYPKEMDKYKHLGYAVLCDVVESTDPKPVFRKYMQSSMRAVKMKGLNTIPSTPLPDYDATKIIYVDNFSYQEGNIRVEKSRVGNRLDVKHIRTKDYKALEEKKNDFSSRDPIYFRQENWKYQQNSSSSRGRSPR